jgi:hypothetical protein
MLLARSPQEIMLERLRIAALTIAVSACASSEQPSAGLRQPAGLWSHSPSVCGPDEVREYQCEELLSVMPVMPAPAPFESCPMNLEGATGTHAPAPPVAIFDPDYTAHIRRRAPPGHSCCYSWCSRLRVAASEQAQAAQSCRGGHELREQYCFDELEGGASEPAIPPFQRCPRTVVPPLSMAFSAPAAASFDPHATGAKRAQGFKECCYGWCSAAPAEAITPRKSDSPPR